MKRLVLTTLTIGLALLSPANAGSTAKVTEEMFGDKWPFTVDSGTVKCEVPGALIFESNQGSSSRHYSLNGTAKAKYGYPYPNEVVDIWKVDSEAAKYGIELRVPTTALETKARGLCR